MLNLGVSAQPCIPKKTMTYAQDLRPSRCETCGAPGGERGGFLEAHIVAKDKRRYLCPLCHACLHLDVAGRIKAGRVIWLPELSQEKLNLLCLSMFVALGQNGPKSTSAVIESAKRLYGAFERRSESIELLLGGGVAKSPLPRQSLSSPTHIASLLVQVQRQSGLSAREMAERIDGMRLLPSPNAFSDYIDNVAQFTSKTCPPKDWLLRATKALEDRERAVEQFSAEST